MSGPLDNPGDAAALAHLFPLTTLLDQNNTKDGYITALLSANYGNMTAKWARCCRKKEQIVTKHFWWLETGPSVGPCSTSVWPLRAAWCRAVRPPRSDTLTLLSSGMMTSAHRSALLAAATCSGVCQFLSRAFTSAE